MPPLSPDLVWITEFSGSIAAYNSLQPLVITVDGFIDYCWLTASWLVNEAYKRSLVTVVHQIALPNRVATCATYRCRVNGEFVFTPKIRSEGNRFSVIPPDYPYGDILFTLETSVLL